MILRQGSSVCWRSSERYKTAPLGTNTEKLQQLRPVSFYLKNAPHGAVQYGLISEEVDKVYPELVVRDASGKIQGVRYDELSPMLLNDVQQQQRKIEAQAVQLHSVQEQFALMQTAFGKLQAKNELLAKR